MFVCIWACVCMCAKCAVCVRLVYRVTFGIVCVSLSGVPVCGLYMSMGAGEGVCRHAHSCHRGRLGLCLQRVTLQDTGWWGDLPVGGGLHCVAQHLCRCAGCPRGVAVSSCLSFPPQSLRKGHHHTHHLRADKMNIFF